jgi:hypothetical protein
MCNRNITQTTQRLEYLSALVLIVTKDNFSLLHYDKKKPLLSLQTMHLYKIFSTLDGWNSHNSKTLNTTNKK